MSLPDIDTKFADWYQEVIYNAELADKSPVRGCIVIRPYGYAIWENIRDHLNNRIKKTGHKNAAFPLLIPESFLKKEAEHVEGFAPEIAVVTYAGGKKLEEPLVIRPTSETIVHYMFARWIKSWRDLPLKINQWANVVRWEMRPRAFLRTTEFFWQEGHTAHATAEQAQQEAELMWKEYIDLAQNLLAIPVIAGIKTDQEKFPGGEKTYTFEAIMPDGKAVQMGTSHLLSQTFAKAFEMDYQDKDGALCYPYLTSWGVTTRLVGALVMMHGDQKGLILPPRVAPIQVVIIPILKKNADNNEDIIKTAVSIADELEKHNVRVHIDTDEQKTPGSKFYKWELKGVPLRLELGARDLENKQVVAVSRLDRSKTFLPIDQISKNIIQSLEQIQNDLFIRAEEKRDSLWEKIDDLKDFGKRLSKEKFFVTSGWCSNPECEKKLKEYQASIRCILEKHTTKKCFACGEKSMYDVVIAKSY